MAVARCSASRRLGCIICLCALLAAVPAWGGAKTVVGWIEYARLYPGGLQIKAKLDSGAKTSSLNAVGVDEFVRDGEPWVRFEVTNWKGRSATFEKQVVRSVKIKEHSGRPQVRPVVLFRICLGGHTREVEVNLVDRSQFNYQLLVGRTFLEGLFVIDVAEKYTAQPECRESGP